MIFKNLTKRVARSLYHSRIGSTIRNSSKRALEHHENSEVTAMGDKPLTGLERLAMNADLALSNAAAGHDKLYESRDDLRHLAKLQYTMFGNNTEIAERKHTNLSNIAYLNAEYRTLADMNGAKSSAKLGMYAAPQNYFDGVLGIDKIDARNLAKAANIMNTNMDLDIRGIGSSETAEQYLRDQRAEFRKAIKDRLSDHWAYQDNTSSLNQFINRQAVKLGKNEVQTNFQSELLRNKAINSIVDSYMERRKQENKCSLNGDLTNYGMTKDNKFGIHLTAKEIEDGFQKVMVEDPVRKYVHQRSYLRELADSVFSMPSFVIDTIRYGPSYTSQTAGRMNLR